MSAGGFAATRVLQHGAMALVQIDPRRDGLDRRQIDVVVGEDVRLIGRRECCAAGACLGVDLARRVGIGCERARDAGPALAAFLLRRCRGTIGLLSARRRQRGVRRRLRRLAGTRLEFHDPREESLDLLKQFVVLRHQLEHQRLQAVFVQRIERLGRHPAFESASRDAINAEAPSQTDAEG